MSVFIGNISRSADYKKIEKELNEFGKCSFNTRGKYGFAEFDNESDADKAIKQMNESEHGGQKLVLEWAKKSANYKGSRTSSNYIRRSRSPGRYNSRRQRSRSRSPRRSSNFERYRRSRSREDRRKKRSRSPEKRYKRSRNQSSSESRDKKKRNHSRSRS